MKNFKYKSFILIFMLFCIFSFSFTKTIGVVQDGIFTNERFPAPPSNQNPNQDEIRDRPRVVTQVIPVTMNENGVFLRRNNVIVGIQKISYIKVAENKETRMYDVECFTSDGGRVVLDSFNTERDAEMYFEEIIRYMRDNRIKVDDR